MKIRTTFRIYKQYLASQKYCLNETNWSDVGRCSSSFNLCRYGVRRALCLRLVSGRKWIVFFFFFFLIYIYKAWTWWMQASWLLYLMLWRLRWWTNGWWRLIILAWPPPRSCSLKWGLVMLYTYGPWYLGGAPWFLLCRCRGSQYPWRIWQAKLEIFCFDRVCHFICKSRSSWPLVGWVVLVHVESWLGRLSSNIALRKLS
jgi:hypothetical protein